MSGAQRPTRRATRSWDWGWARRGAVALAPFAALIALLHATIVLREPPVVALVHYLAGAVYGVLVGLALGGLASMARPARPRRRVRRPRRTAWVAHRAVRAV